MESVVSDFDGVVTDIQKEAENYDAFFTERLSLAIGIPIVELDARLSKERDEILKHPNDFGWPFVQANGEEIIVAPATADPYVFMRVRANRVITESRDGGSHSMPDRENTQVFLQRLYEECRTQVGTIFRPDAANYLRELQKKTKLAIATNSKTDQVKLHVESIIGENNIVIFGQAKKYSIDPFWLDMPETVSIAGLSRPVYLRRKYYYQTLESIAKMNGSITCTVGDSWELDLSLPERLGIDTVLLLTENTPVWEMKHFVNHERGFSLGSLPSIIDKIVR